MIVRAWESDEHYNAEIRVDHVRDLDLGPINVPGFNGNVTARDFVENRFSMDGRPMLDFGSSGLEGSTIFSAIHKSRDVAKRTFETWQHRMRDQRR